jgi:hypothetical protein
MDPPLILSVYLCPPPYLAHTYARTHARMHARTRTPLLAGGRQSFDGRVIRSHAYERRRERVPNQGIPPSRWVHVHLDNWNVGQTFGGSGHFSGLCRLPLPLGVGYVCIVCGGKDGATAWKEVVTGHPIYLARSLCATAWKEVVTVPFPSLARYPPPPLVLQTRSRRSLNGRGRA